MLTSLERYISDFMISLLFLVFGMVFLNIYTNALPSIILFGYFFLHYLIRGLYRLFKDKKQGSINS